MKRSRSVLLGSIPYAVTVGIFLLIFRRIPFQQLVDALQEADYGYFLLLMIPNAVFYFCWDTLVLTCVIRWFHGPVRYREMLPARAASYVAAVFNTNLARGTLAAYLMRQLRAPLLQLGSTVIFLVLTEYTHLVGWATLGMMLGRDHVPAGLFWVPPAVALFWFFFLVYARLGLTPWALMRSATTGLHGSDRRVWINAREWSIFRTFKIAPVRRYVQIVLLRAPMFFISLCLHYLAAGAFGIHIPFVTLLAFLPVIFMLAALPITVAHLGTTQAAWLFFFGSLAPEPRLLAFSLAAHATFMAIRALIGVAFIGRAYRDLLAGQRKKRAGAASQGAFPPGQ